MTINQVSTLLMLTAFATAITSAGINVHRTGNRPSESIPAAPSPLPIPYPYPPATPAR